MRDRAPATTREHRHGYLAASEAEARDAVLFADRSRELKPAVPEEVRFDADLGRWDAAVAVALHRAPGAHVHQLWEVARGVWASLDIEALRAEQAAIPRRPQTAAEEFRQRRRELL